MDQLEQDWQDLIEESKTAHDSPYSTIDGEAVIWASGRITELEARNKELEAHCNQMLNTWKSLCDVKGWDWRHMSQFDKADEFLK